MNHDSTFDLSDFDPWNSQDENDLYDPAFGPRAIEHGRFRPLPVSGGTLRGVRLA